MRKPCRPATFRTLYAPGKRPRRRGSGGGGGLEPLVSIDFKNGVYSWGGSTHTLNETVEENASFGVTWDSSKVVASVGLRITGTAGMEVAGSLTSGAADALLPVGTGLVLVVTASASVGAMLNKFATCHVEIDDVPGFTEVWDIALENSFELGDVVIIGDTNSVEEELTLDVVATHKVAARFTPSAITGSADGNAVETASGDPADNSAGNLITFYLTTTTDDIGTATAIIEKVDFYSADDVVDADLPGLST